MVFIGNSQRPWLARLAVDMDGPDIQSDEGLGFRESRVVGMGPG
jgi:hypothetical protein